MSDTNTTATEGILSFDFHAPCEKADTNVPQGLMSVDFIVDSGDTLYLIEVKDFEHPNAPPENKKRDYKKLTDPNAAFPLEMGMKVKDTILRLYSNSKEFTKPVIFILLIKLAKLEPRERQRLFAQTKKYIPTGLNNSPKFSKIHLDVPTFQDFQSKYGFSVTFAQNKIT